VLRPAWEMAPVVVVAEGVRPAADHTPGGYAGTRNEETHPSKRPGRSGREWGCFFLTATAIGAGRSILLRERCARQSKSGEASLPEKSAYSLFPEWHRKDRTPQLNRQCSPCFIRGRKGVRGGGGGGADLRAGPARGAPRVPVGWPTRRPRRRGGRGPPATGVGWGPGKGAKVRGDPPPLLGA